MADERSEKRGALSLYADAGANQPKWDLFGPTVDDDIRRAIWRYGAEAVKVSVKEATKAKRGRKMEPDWSELREVIYADALEWLAGGDPFSARSNYAIAKDFAERNPGQSAVSTHQRIERKLSGRAGPYDRRWFTLVTAEDLSQDRFSYTANLRTLKALADLPEASGADIWQSALDRTRATIADFEAREGEPPDTAMTIKEIEEAVRKPGKPGELFELRSFKTTPLGKLLSDAVKDVRDRDETEREF